MLKMKVCTMYLARWSSCFELIGVIMPSIYNGLVYGWI